MKGIAGKLAKLNHKQLVALTLNLAENRFLGLSNIVNHSNRNVLSPTTLDAHLHVAPSEPASSQDDCDRKDSIRSKLLNSPNVLRKKLYTDFLCEEMSTILSRLDTISSDASLNELGIDSLMAVEIRSKIVKSLDIDLDVGVIYNFSTASEIADHALKVFESQNKAVVDVDMPIDTEHFNSPDEEIAIVSMSCRFPGHSDSVEQFWELLVDGRDGIGEMEDERWKMSSYYHPDPGQPGKMYSKWSGLISNVKEFDAKFFGISDLEADNMDPQQRVLLEVVWELIENGNYSVAELKGALGGVYIGAVNSEYAVLQSQLEDEALNGYMGTGNATSVIAGRIAYQLGLVGPAMVVDTACSSSLVSVNLACQSLKRGEVDLAVAGGINLNLTPKTNIILSKAMMLSPDGRCKAFDHRANGYVRSEGCGLLLLKRLSDAQRDGDDIIALIKGAAVNQDGHSQGLTAPSGDAQKTVLAKALESAQLAPNQMHYIEAHGTGTALGDPIELSAINDVYAHRPIAANKLMIGSVKSNIGHTEAAAGVAGLIKSALIAKNRFIPKSLHIEKLNPRFNFDTNAIEIVQASKQIECDGPLNIGVSSFGMSGTNAHLIVSSYHKIEDQVIDLDQKTGKGEIDSSIDVLTLSAKNQTALQDLVSEYITFLLNADESLFPAICLASNLSRDHFKHRVAFAYETREKLLADLFRSQSNDDMTENASSRTVFAFTGQGSQYPGMAKNYFESFPVFRDSILSCHNIIKSLGAGDLMNIMWGDQTDLLHETQYTQLVLFAYEYALAQLWMSWGIIPDEICGHSVGEIAGACIAGVFSLEDGCKIAVSRGRLMHALTDKGDMFVVFSDYASVEPFLASEPDFISIAAVNGPANTVISGESTKLKHALGEFEKKGFKFTELKVSHPFHSPLMRPMLGALADVLSNITFSKPVIPFVSSVTGTVENDSVASAAYWVNHVEARVRFDKVIDRLEEIQNHTVIEIGPGSALSSMIKSAVKSSGNRCVVSASKSEPGKLSLSKTIAEIYGAGLAIDLAQVHPNLKAKSIARVIKLPNYPFQRSTHWPNPSDAKNRLSIRASKEVHPLLGGRLSLPNVCFQQVYSPTIQTFFEDHKVFNIRLVPGSSYMEIGVALSHQIFGGESASIRDVKILGPLSFADETEKQTVQIHTHKISPNCFEYYIYSCDAENTKAKTQDQEEKWHLHAKGFIERQDSNEVLNKGQILDIPSVLSTFPDEGNVNDLYRELANIGLQYGSRHQGIKILRLKNDASISRIDLEGEIDSKGYYLHPAMLDSCFHQIAPLLKKYHDVEYDILVPVSAKKVEFFGGASHSVWCKASIVDVSPVRTIVNFSLFNLDGIQVANVERLMFRRVSYSNIASQIRSDYAELLYQVNWEVQPLALNSELNISEQTIVVFGSDDRNIQTMVARLSENNTIIFIKPGCVGCPLYSPSAPLLNNSYDGDFSVDTYEVDFSNASQIKFLIGSICKEHNLDYVINALSLSHKRDNSTIPVQREELVELTKTSSMALLHIVQGLVKNQVQLKQLAVLSDHTQSVCPNDTPFGVASSAVWGLAKVISAEHVELNCKKYDLDGANQGDSIQKFLSEFGQFAESDSIAYRRDTRYVAYLDKMSVSRNKKLKSFKFLAESSYLITGGTGALGFYIAEWMINQGARHIILVSRRNADAEQAVKIDALEALGASVYNIKADVANAQEVESMIETIGQVAPVIRGVVHAAGVLDDGVLIQQDWSRFEKVYGSKVYGSWNLHTYLNNELLDFTIYFSSAASILGTPGQANYAGANGFMDSLAQFRSNQGFPTMSMNWGPWSEIGMSTSDVVQSRIEKENIVGLISPAVAIEYFEHALELLQAELDTAQMGVVSINWENLSRSFKELSLAPDYFSKLMVEVEVGEIDTGMTEEFLEGLARATDGKSRLDYVEYFIRKKVCDVAGIHDVASIKNSDSLFDVGVDSLMAVDLRNVLSAILQEQIPVTFLFEYDSTIELANFILRKLGGSPTSSASLELIRSDPHIVELVKCENTESNMTPLFLFHAVGGSVFSYSLISRMVDMNAPIYGVQSNNDEVDYPDSIENMASQYIESIQTVQKQGPYRLAGWSMGGYLAYEVAKQLTEKGETVKDVLMIDSVQGELNTEGETRKGSSESLLVFAFDLGIPQKNLDLAQVDDTDIDRYVKYIFDLAMDLHLIPESMSLEVFSRRFDRFNANMNALLKYVPTPYGGHVARIDASERIMKIRDTAWTSLCGHLEQHTVSGNHFTILANPNVKTLSNIISNVYKNQQNTHLGGS